MTELPTVSKQELLAAIRAGVHDAMWKMITNATQAPCADFYDAVKDGVAAGTAKAGGRRRDDHENGP
jgi:hypothetical protein